MNIERSDGSSAVRCNKFYIIATAASGKSTFTDQNDSYLGYQVVDFDKRLPDYSFITKIIPYLSRLHPALRHLAAKRPDFADHMKNSYFQQLFDSILKQDGPIVVLGRKTLDDLDHRKYRDSIEFSIVLIPEDDHRRNRASRKKQMRNPFPFFIIGRPTLKKSDPYDRDFDRMHRSTVFPSMTAFPPQSRTCTSLFQNVH